MGGIAGLIDLKERPDRELLMRMFDRVSSRGPDGQGEFFDNHAGMAHAVLTVSEDRGIQPIVTDDHVLMLDGWIYDHTLPRSLAGPAAPSASDARALLAAWQRWGRDFVDHIEGDFAVAVWDRREQELHLFRDRFGIRPLFWAHDGQRFGFASTLPALLPLDWVGTAPDPHRLAEYLSFQVVHAPRTLLTDVHQVAPGHWLKFNRNGVVTRRWWAIRYAPPGTPRPRDAEILEEVQRSVQDAVRRRVPRDAKAGLFLSGGLGSTAIAAASRRLHLDLPTYTISFTDDPFPELPFAGRVARLLGLAHQEIVVGTSDVASAFEPAVRAMGHPIGNPTALLQLLLGQHAKSEVDVVLAGDGGPELFGGRMLDDLQRQLNAARVGRHLPKRVKGLLRKTLGERGERLTAPPERIALLKGIGGARLFTLEDRRALLLDAAWAQPKIRQDVLTAYHANLDTDPINTALHGFLRSWLGEGALARAGWMATAAGLDARFPLLDHEIVAYAAGLPGAVKVRRVGGSLHTRWPLRAMLDGVLPAPLVNRPRRGMPRPPDAWLLNAGRLFFEERWEKLRANEHGFFQQAGLDDLRARLPGDPAVGLKFWSLFILDAWLDGLR